MPRERVTGEVARALFAQNKLEFITNESSGSNHTETLYKVILSGSNCDQCPLPASLLRHTFDHLGQVFINLTRDRHAPKTYHEMYLAKGE